jgi:hypothetical protein
MKILGAHGYLQKGPLSGLWLLALVLACGSHCVHAAHKAPTYASDSVRSQIGRSRNLPDVVAMRKQLVPGGSAIP